MKKSRIIASALLAGVIFIGAGYAAWTDNLNIKSTVKTGELNVEFVDTATLLNHKYPFGKELELGDKYVKSEVKMQDSKTVTVKLDNLYPGTGLLYAARFDNKGTIPAVIDRVEVKFTKDNQLLKDNLVVVGGFVQQSDKGKIKDGYIFPTLKDGLFRDKIYLKDLQYNLNKMLEGKRLEPGDYITLDIPEELKPEIVNVLDEEEIKGFNADEDNCVIMGLPSKVGNNLKNQSAEFEIKLYFKQHNQ